MFTEGDEEANTDAINEVISHIAENTPGVVPLEKIEPSAIIIYGKLIAVEPGSKLEQVISEGPDALKKYIASGAIEELHDVMPHEDDTDYLNAEYLDDDSLPCAAAASDVQLPPPLPSSKMAQQVAQQNQMNMATQLQNLQNQGLTLNLDPSHKGEKQRRSRFSDLDDDGPRNLDTDLRLLPGHQAPSHMHGLFGNRNSNNSDMDMRISGRKMSQNNQDVDMRSLDDMHDDSSREYDSPEYRNSYFEGNNGFRPQFGEGDGPNFSNSQQMRPQQWSSHQHQNNGGPSGHQNQFNPQMNENFSPRSNFMPNQNGPFPPFHQPQSHAGGGNFRGDFRGPPPFAGGNNNFNRPDGPPGGPPGHWNNGMSRGDGGFRGRGNFGGPMRGPMRGGPRPRFQGSRGPWGPPPRRDGPNNSMRGRNVF